MGERKVGRSEALLQRSFDWELSALHLALGTNFLLL